MYKLVPLAAFAVILTACSEPAAAPADTMAATPAATEPALVIARRLTDSFRDIPHFPLSIDCELDALLAARGREIAAILVEPRIQGAGGMLFHDDAVLRALAEAHEAGTVPPVLRGIASKAAVYDLVGTVIDRSRAGYYDAGIDTGQPASTSPAAVALWAMIEAPSLYPFLSARDTLRALMFEDGALADQLLSAFISRREALLDDLRRMEADPAIARLVDTRRLIRLLEDYPEQSSTRPDVWFQYMLAVPMGIAAGRFIRHVNGSNA